MSKVTEVEIQAIREIVMEAEAINREIEEFLSTKKACLPAVLFAIRVFDQLNKERFPDLHESICVLIREAQSKGENDESKSSD